MPSNNLAAVNVSFVWPTFHNDGECCLESVKQVLALGVDPSRCHVGNTIGKELRAPEHEALEALGVRVRPSRFRRSDTYPEIINLLTLMLAAGAQDEAEWVFQLDSDTMLCRLDPLREAIGSGVVAMAQTWPQCDFAGCAWLCRLEVVRALRNEFRDRNVLKIPHYTISDVSTGLMLDHLYGRESVRRHGWEGEDRYCGGWRYEQETLSLADYARRFDAVTFGNRMLIRGAGRPVREIVAATMAEFRRVLGGALT